MGIGMRPHEISIPTQVVQRRYVVRQFHAVHGAAIQIYGSEYADLSAWHKQTSIDLVANVLVVSIELYDLAGLDLLLNTCFVLAVGFRLDLAAKDRSLGLRRSDEQSV